MGRETGRTTRFMCVCVCVCVCVRGCVFLCPRRVSSVPLALHPPPQEEKKEVRSSSRLL
jgi:hypothetical protein